MMNIYWICKSFKELNTNELYEILHIRQLVFILEQICPYLDADKKDYKAWHLLGYDSEGNLVAYARLLPKGVSYQEYSSIGRVLSLPSVRRSGVGKELMSRVMQEMERLFPAQSICISAQSYLVPFYETFGFINTGKEYLEDDIPHTEMIKWTTL